MRTLEHGGSLFLFLCRQHRRLVEVFAAVGALLLHGLVKFSLLMRVSAYDADLCRSLSLWLRAVSVHLASSLMGQWAPQLGLELWLGILSQRLSPLVLQPFLRPSASLIVHPSIWLQRVRQQCPVQWRFVGQHPASVSASGTLSADHFH